MIYIEKNKKNYIFLTLNESGYTNYLFKFEYQNYLDSGIYFNPQDISEHKLRYNKFEIIDSDLVAPGLTGSTFNLNPGQWSYTIWGTNDVIDMNDISGLTASQYIIEEGRMYVEGKNTQINDIYN